MNTLFRPETWFSLAGILWIYIFVSLSFFGNHSADFKSISQSEQLSLHNNVLSTSEYQPPAEAPDNFVQIANFYLTFDSDDGQNDMSPVSQPAIHPIIKNIFAYSHLPLKNSPNTLRMITSVLRV